jgi:tetratricopeptide (TPR) repeat protein
MSNSEPTPAIPPSPAPRRGIRRIWIFLGIFILAVAAGAVTGTVAGKNLHDQRQAASVAAFNLEQYQLAAVDYQDGNYKRAVERLESVLKSDPGFPGAAQLREKALTAMNATPTPLPTETPVPSPTPDAPRAEQLLAQAKQEFVDQKYVDMIETLLKIKIEIPSYQPERVDGLLWVGLRYQGVHLIKETNRLAEGIYYLDLAANYAPLDNEAQAQITFALNFLSIYQSAYYYRNKDIEKSWKYFAQAVSIRPYYSDTLLHDYADVLVQNGDAIVHQNACAAWWYYEMALAQVPNYEPAVKGRDYAIENCGENAPAPPEGYGPAGESTPEG